MGQKKKEPTLLETLIGGQSGPKATRQLYGPPKSNDLLSLGSRKFGRSIGGAQPKKGSSPKQAKPAVKRSATGYAETLAGLERGEQEAFAKRVYDLKMARGGKITADIVGEAHTEMLGEKLRRAIGMGETKISSGFDFVPESWKRHEAAEIARSRQHDRLGLPATPEAMVRDLLEPRSRKNEERRAFLEHQEWLPKNLKGVFDWAVTIERVRWKGRPVPEWRIAEISGELLDPDGMTRWQKTIGAFRKDYRKRQVEDAQWREEHMRFHSSPNRLPEEAQESERLWVAQRRAEELARLGTTEAFFREAQRANHRWVQTFDGRGVPLEEVQHVARTWGGIEPIPLRSEEDQALIDADPMNYAKVRKRMWDAGPRMIGEGTDGMLAGLAYFADPSLKKNLLLGMINEYQTKRGRLPDEAEVRRMSVKADEAAAGQVKLYASLVPLVLSGPAALGAAGVASGADFVKSFAKAAKPTLTAQEQRELEQQLVFAGASAAMPYIAKGAGTAFEKVGRNVMKEHPQLFAKASMAVPFVAKGAGTSLKKVGDDMVKATDSAKRKLAEAQANRLGKQYATGQKELFWIREAADGSKRVQWKISAAYQPPDVMKAAKARAAAELELSGVSRKSATQKVNRAVIRARDAARAKAKTTNLQRVQRFFYDDRDFKVISKEYWDKRGGADGESLHHWLYRQSDEGVGRGHRNAGYNLVRLVRWNPFHDTLDLNRWIGLAQKWKNRPLDAKKARLIEKLIRVAIPGKVATGGAFGAYVGHELTDED